MAASVQIEVREDLFQELGIVSAELEDSDSDFGKQELDSVLYSLVVIVFRHLPGRLHHSHKVLITRAAHREIRVVVEELLSGNDAIFVSFHSFEVGQELCQDLLSRLSALDEVGVHGHVVNTN